MKLLSFEGYKMLNESSKAFEADLDKTLNENIGAALGSPVKFTKIKNNAKKYQQALVQIAINNLDFEKKKAAGNMDKDKAEVLKAASAQKNQALKDQASAISDRMDQLATTPGLKKVASIAKNKSKMAAAETALKTADGEEAKALKLKIKGLNAKVAADQKELKDYEKADDNKADDTPNQQNLDNVKTDGKDKDPQGDAKKKAIEDAQKEVDKAKAAYDAVKDGDDEKAKLQAEIKFKQAQQKKAKAEGNSELVQGLGDDIGEVMKKIQDLDKTPDDPGAKLEADIAAFNDNIEAERTTMNKAVKDLEQAKRDLKTGRGSEEQVQKLQKAIEDSKEDIAELKKGEADAKKQLANLSKPKESFQPLEESVSEKFRRLMKNV
jgi:hypothetical protein